MTREQQKYIEKLYDEEYQHLMSFARSALGNAVLAEEAVQEIFAVACERVERLCQSPNPRGWLVNTLKFVIRNLERRRKVAEKVVTDSLGDRLDLLSAPSDHVDLKLLYGNVADTEEFQLMMSIGVEGMSFIEIAEEQGVSVSTVKKRAERARRILQRRIK